MNIKSCEKVEEQVEIYLNYKYTYCFSLARQLSELTIDEGETPLQCMKRQLVLHCHFMAKGSKVEFMFWTMLGKLPAEVQDYVELHLPEVEYTPRDLLSFLESAQVAHMPYTKTAN
ncbi:hypothetical protein GGF37_001689 [Kickxella alabastrina]|nr:hypothetical protein GGF37_001689 [Kickxella alabastrina]